MTIELASFVFGALLVSTGFFGGGLSIKDISVPKIGIVPRIASMGLGGFFILTGLVLSVMDSADPIPVADAERTEELASQPSTPLAPELTVQPSTDDQYFQQQVDAKLFRRIG